jgi:signal transduction histidine kinase
VIAVCVPPVLVLAVATVGPASHAVAAACALAQLPIAVLAICARRLTRHEAAPEATVIQLGSRAEHAEHELALEQDRLHQLRGTVAGLTNSYRLLHDRGAQISPVRRSRLERLHDAELTRLERLTETRSRSAPEAVDLDAVVEPLVDAVRLGGHTVRWTRVGCRVWAAGDDVVEIVDVLLENATRHAGGRGVEVAATPRDDVVDLRVSDQGPGIAPEVMSKLFVRGARRKGSPGQGLGLDIARRLAHEMGGQHRLETPRLGTPGAAFVLTLPAAGGGAACLGLSG